MELKRIYDDTDLLRYRAEHAAAVRGWLEKFDALGVPTTLVPAFAKQSADAMVTGPALAGVDVVHTGATPQQNFSTTLVTDFLRLRLMEIDGAVLTLHTQSKPLRYTILREPGRWCLHCGEKLADDENGELARLHVALNHADAAPIEDNPAGYIWHKYFECVLDADQHARFARGGSNG